MAETPTWHAWSYGASGRFFVADEITVPPLMWLGWVHSVSPPASGEAAKPRLVSVNAPFGFTMGSPPPQGTVVLTYSDGSTERRVVTEKRYLDIKANLEAGL